MNLYPKGYNNYHVSDGKFFQKLDARMEIFCIFATDNILFI